MIKSWLGQGIRRNEQNILNCLRNEKDRGAKKLCLTTTSCGLSSILIYNIEIYIGAAYRSASLFHPSSPVTINDALWFITPASVCSDLSTYCYDAFVWKFFNVRADSSNESTCEHLVDQFWPNLNIMILELMSMFRSGDGVETFSHIFLYDFCPIVDSMTTYRTLTQTNHHYHTISTSGRIWSSSRQFVLILNCT